MSNLDETIRQALQSDDPIDINDNREQSLLKEAIQVFRSRKRHFVIISVVVTLAAMALAVYTAIRFFGAEDTRSMIAWSVVFLLCAVTTSMMKVWFWMQMERYAILREVKRLELQVARLVERLPEP